MCCKYDMGTYEFHFPMVVGPRYIPGTPSGGAAADAGELAGQGLAAGRRYRPRARRLADQPAGAEAGRSQRPRYFALA